MCELGCGKCDCVLDFGKILWNIIDECFFPTTKYGGINWEKIKLHFPKRLHTTENTIVSSPVTQYCKNTYGEMQLYIPNAKILRNQQRGNTCVFPQQKIERLRLWKNTNVICYLRNTKKYKCAAYICFFLFLQTYGEQQLWGIQFPPQQKIQRIKLCGNTIVCCSLGNTIKYTCDAYICFFCMQTYDERRVVKKHVFFK